MVVYIIYKIRIQRFLLSTFIVKEKDAKSNSNSKGSSWDEIKIVQQITYSYIPSQAVNIGQFGV